MLKFPYNLSITTKLTFVDEENKEIQCNWNGITMQMQQQVAPEDSSKVEGIIKGLNYPIELLRGVEILPLQRGFTKLSYSPVALAPFLQNENEIATLLAQDQYLEGKLQAACKKIFPDKNLHVRPQLGTGVFSLQVTDKNTGITTELANEGFGINQIVYILTRLLNEDSKIICIEEPEVHLHPSTQARLMKFITTYCKEKDKSVIITTHSEHILISLLSQVSKGDLHPTDVSFYFCSKDGTQTIIEKQKINEQGQIKGGLRSFIESEIDDLEALLNSK